MIGVFRRTPVGDWLEARMIADGFDQETFKLWRQQGLSKSPADGTWHAPVRTAKQSGGPDALKSEVPTSALVGANNVRQGT